MITGSHNPADYNGFKMVLQQRRLLRRATSRRLGRMAAAGDWEQGAGSVRDEDVMERYVERLLQGFDGGAYRIGWDAGNGAAGPVVERLVEAPARRASSPSSPRSTAASPTIIPIPTDESNLDDLKRAGRARRASISESPSTATATGIGAVDGEGRVVWGDQLLSILAEPVLREVPGATIIADVKASQALFDRIAELGGAAAACGRPATA